MRIAIFLTLLFLTPAQADMVIMGATLNGFKYNGNITVTFNNQIVTINGNTVTFNHA